MKKIIFLLIILMIYGLGFSAEYVLVNKDESDSNNKFYGYQLEQSTAWKGIYISSSTILYNQGISTTTYSSWWTVHADTTTVHYRDGFNYQKYNYPN